MSAKKSTVKFKARTIREIEQEEDSRVFALNRSKEAANINLNVKLRNGESSLVTMPFSPCPIDLTSFCSKADLLAEPVFRRLVATNLVVLVDTEEASKFVLEDPRGIKETQRIFKEASIVAEPISAGDVETEFAGADNRTEEERMGVESSNPFVEMIIARATNPDEDINDIISDLESRAHTLTPEDLQYIADNSNSSDLKEWAIELQGETE